MKPELRIDWATHEAAKYACESWHYSKCIPKSKLVKVGAWENGKFIGVVIFSYGANAKLGSPYGLAMNECVELTRIALNKHFTPVSKIIVLAIKFLCKANPGLRLIVSYADADAGHHGGIYQATNWIYEGLFGLGMVGAYVVDGIKIHPKTMFDRLGTHARDAVREKYPGMELFYTKGKHKYLMPLDAKTKHSLMILSKPYPKRVKQANSGDQLERGGAAPTYTLHSSAEVNNVSQTA